MYRPRAGGASVILKRKCNSEVTGRYTVRVYRWRAAALSFLFLLVPGRLLSGDPISTSAAAPLTFHLGPVTLAPSGFLESLTPVRSRTTHDDASTRFGSIPLTDSPLEAIHSFRHSRIALDFSAPGGPGRFSGYIETDFLNRPPLQPYRFRLYFARYTVGDWEFSGGQEYSLLRPNRAGISSETNLMNTRVADPAYHVGLLGYRNRQVRVMRLMGSWSAAATFEDGRNGAAKLVRDSRRLHWEVAGLAGRGGRYGASVAAVVHAAPGIDVVAQQGIVRGETDYTLRVVPEDVAGVSTLAGLEAKVGRLFEFYGYGGAVRGRRPPGNRLVAEFTAGLARSVQRDRYGSTTVGAQLSRFHRTVWQGPEGPMNMFMLQIRRSLEPHR